MTQYAFDAAGFVTFDLANGTIRSKNMESLTLVPLSLIAKLPLSPVLLEESKSWGFKQGKVLADILGNKSNAEMDVLVDYLSGELAVMGFGRISIKIYGEALLFEVTATDSVLLTDTIKAVLGNFLKGYMKALMPTLSFEIVPLTNGEQSELFFVGNKSAIKQIQLDIKNGISPMSSIERIMEKG